MQSLSHKSKTPLTKLTKSSRGLRQPIKCPKCDYQTTVTAQLAKHMKKSHGETINSKLPAMLEECNDVTPKQLILSLEEETTNGEEKSEKNDIKELSDDSEKGPSELLCMLCGAEYVEDEDLDMHVRNTHEVKCNICAKIFYTDYDLEQHMLNHEEIEIDDEDSPNNSEEAVTQATACPTSSQIDFAVFECELCAYRTTSAEDLKNHIIAHNLIKKCDKCEFIAKTEFAFQLHIQSEHKPSPAVNPFPCPTCGTTFDDITFLN